MKAEKENVFAMMWGLWHRRNKKVFENKVFQPDEAAKNALALMQDFQTIPWTGSSPGFTKGPWLAPPAGVLKQNLDGAELVKQVQGVFFAMKRVI